MQTNKNNARKEEPKNNRWSNKIGDLYNLHKMCREKGYKLNGKNKFDNNK